MHVTGKQKEGLFRKLARFVFIDLWESTYRRKKRRCLYRYHLFGASPWKDQYIYYPRYRWIIRKKK